MKSVIPNPTFLHMSQQEVSDRLDAWEESPTHSTPVDDPVVAEVERLIAGYAARLDSFCRQYGTIPEDALLCHPTSGIEQVAFAIFTEALHDSLMDADEE